MKNNFLYYLSLLLIITITAHAQKFRKTVVSIKGNQFYINWQPTYKNRYWQNCKIEGLLMNSRMVQGIFDDLNPATQSQFVYADTKKWDADRNTNEFIENMASWKKYGLLAFTLNLQGGSPMGYGNKGSVNSSFDEKGNLRKLYIDRLERILDKADRIGMVVILGYFYFGQDEMLENEAAVVNATDKITNWLISKKYKNILIEINNETDIAYDHEILKPKRVTELIQRVKRISKNKLLVSTSFGGGTIPSSEVIAASNFVLLHGNGVKESTKIKLMVDSTRASKGYRSQPIVFNEDDHFDFDSDSCNFVTATKSYTSWGYFDYRMKGEGFENGYQSVPVDWGINSLRKKAFFLKLKQMTINNSIHK